MMTSLWIVFLTMMNTNLWGQVEESSVNILRKHKAPVKAITFSPNDSILATGGEDKMIYFWNSKTGTLDGSIENVFTVKALQFAGNGNIFDVQFSPDGNHMISCGADESKQDYAAREIEANKFLNDLYDQYYIEYLEMLKQLPLGGDQPNTDYRILIT